MVARIPCDPWHRRLYPSNGIPNLDTTPPGVVPFFKGFARSACFAASSWRAGPPFRYPCMWTAKRNPTMEI
jgi:hypothetical protein